MQQGGEEEEGPAETQLRSSSFFIPGTLNELGDHATPTRRRVRKTRDSAIVLSFEAMRRCIESSPPALEVPTQAISKNNGLQESAVRRLQRMWRFLGKAKRESRGAGVIQRWYRRRSFLDKRRMLKTQINFWTRRQSELVWSMVLGHRVRVLLRSEACRVAIASICDTCDVLYDVLVVFRGANQVPSVDMTLLSAQSRAKRIKAALDCVVCMRISGMGKVLKERGLTSRDGDLATSLIRQLSSNKARFRDLVFRPSRWRVLPAPGYLDLRKSLHINRALVVPPKTPPRSLRGGGADNLSTPPRNRVAPTGVAIGGASAVSLPPPPPQAAATTAAALASSSLAVSPPCPPSRGPRRSSPRAHVQLEVLCADRLSAARRRRAGSTPDDGDKPDRKPGLRVTLLLPPQPTAAPGPLSAVKKLSRDFSDTTLCPRWDCTLQVPLPVPKSLIPPTDVLVGSSDGQQQLDAKAYAGLMDWWAGGILRIEVIDGERFNSDIFLGQQELFLSQFLLAPSICGTFQLSKQNSTDRVAGTITLNAYLHLPEISSLIEASAMRPASTSGAEANETREPLQPPQPAFRIARSVLTQSRNRTPPSLSALRSCSPVKTDTAAVTVTTSAALEPSSPPPPPPPPPTSSRPVTAGEHERRRQITDCLTGLEAQLASLDALSGLINTKFQTKGAGGGVGRTSL